MMAEERIKAIHLINMNKKNPSFFNVIGVTVNLKQQKPESNNNSDSRRE